MQGQVSDLGAAMPLAALMEIGQRSQDIINQSNASVVIPAWQDRIQRSATVCLDKIILAIKINRGNTGTDIGQGLQAHPFFKNSQRPKMLGRHPAAK